MKHPLHVHRFDRPGCRTRGWQVRVIRDGWCWSRLFSDRKCGGERKAFRAAVEFRDCLLRFIPRRPAAWSGT